MEKIQKKICQIIFAMAFISAGAFASGSTVSLDGEEPPVVHLKNNSINLLKMPFVVYKAQIATKYPEDFKAQAKNTSIVIAVSADNKKESGDLLVFSSKGNAYLIKIDAAGKKQVFDFITNKEERYVPPQAQVFETGKIEQDVKNLIRRVIRKRDIPGYKKVRVKRIFNTPDLQMQKNIMFDGGKYRVEEWLVKNISTDRLTLDYENFYTNGILAIAFEKSTLQPGEITKMWLIVNKATVVDRLKRKRQE